MLPVCVGSYLERQLHGQKTEGTLQYPVLGRQGLAELVIL